MLIGIAFIPVQLSYMLAEVSIRRHSGGVSCPLTIRIIYKFNNILVSISPFISLFTAEFYDRFLLLQACLVRNTKILRDWTNRRAT